MHSEWTFISGIGLPVIQRNHVHPRDWKADCTLFPIFRISPISYLLPFPLSWFPRFLRARLAIVRNVDRISFRFRCLFSSTTVESISNGEWIAFSSIRLWHGDERSTRRGWYVITIKLASFRLINSITRCTLAV